MSSFLKKLAKKEILVPHLEMWFSKGIFPDSLPIVINPNKPPDDAFHPSSDAVDCLRRLYAKHTGQLTSRPLTGQSQKTFQIGHMYHAWLQYIIVNELKFSTDEDIERYFSHHATTENGNSWWMAGSTDISHCHIPGHDEPYLIDIKTVNSRYYSQGFPSDVWEKYVVQCQIYLDWHDVNKAIILCCNKDAPHAFKEFLIERDHRIADAVYKRWGLLADALATNTPPECDCGDENCSVKDMNLESALY